MPRRKIAVGHDHFRPTVAFHRCLEGLKRGFAVAKFGDMAFLNLTLMIDGSPEVVGFAVDRHEDFVEVSPVLHARAHAINPPHPDLGREHRTKPVPPVSHRLMADLDPAFVQKIFHVVQRQRIPNVKHHREADYTGKGFEVSERTAICHVLNPRCAASGLNRYCSDSTFRHAW